MRHQKIDASDVVFMIRGTGPLSSASHDLSATSSPMRQSETPTQVSETPSRSRRWRHKTKRAMQLSGGSSRAERTRDLLIKTKLKLAFTQSALAVPSANSGASGAAATRRGAPERRPQSPSASGDEETLKQASARSAQVLNKFVKIKITSHRILYKRGPSSESSCCRGMVPRQPQSR